MDLSERIARRQQTSASGVLITDESALNPAVHLAEPVGRGPVLEQLLDAVGPVFEGEVPDNVAVSGPSGAGKSAVVTALFSHLNESFVERTGAIHTTTRGGQRKPTAQFAYINTRRIDSEFQFYHAILDTISSEPVPRRGIGTDELREKLVSSVGDNGAVLVGVDHVDEGSTSIEGVVDILKPVEPSIGLLVVGERPPDDWDGQTIDIERYRSHALVDLLTERASYGLTSGTISHSLARQIAGWADGDAHDALAALFGAAIVAQDDGDDRISAAHIETGMGAVPEDCVQIGRVLALPDNRRTVLAELLAVDSESITISKAAERIGQRIDLSPSTVQRFIYELAEDGILERTVVDDGRSNGRQPTAVVPRFPTLVFQRLEGRSRL